MISELSATSSVAEPVLLCMERLGIDEALAEFCSPVMRSSIANMRSFAKAEGRDVRVVVTTGGGPLEEAVWDLPNLGLIVVLGVGYDGIDLNRARERGLRVTIGRGVNDADVADLALGLLLASVRKIAQGDRLVRAGQWKKQPELTMARSVSQLKCGIVGLGAIGSAIARRLTGFGCPITWWGPRPKPGAAWPRAESLLALARDSDALIIAAPATEASEGLIDATILEALGPRAYLVNISRGSLVDEPALLAALRSERLAGAGLDVFATEPTDAAAWRDLDSVVLSPHIAGFAEHAIDQIRANCIENVKAFLTGQPLLTPLV